MTPAPQPVAMGWKPSWPATRQHVLDWWDHRGLMVGCWTPPEVLPPRVDAPRPPPADPATDATDAERRAQINHACCARQWTGLDFLPMSRTDLGPGSLATLLGCEPSFGPDTIWFEACWEHLSEPERQPRLSFDPNHHWWQTQEAILRACRQRAGDHYAVTIPDLVEGLDILASLRGSQTVMVDLVERPEWVLDKLAEINQVWFEVHERCHGICRMSDGWTIFGAFMVPSPGRVAKLQCDASAMFSPRMFRRFAVPFLSEQCAWLDHSLYHLDGSQALCHLDQLLAIADLDAIEWTPDPKVPGGGDPCWYDLYRRIKAAGKSVQAVGIRTEQIAPLLDAVGPEGMYLVANAHDLATCENIERIVKRYR